MNQISSKSALVIIDIINPFHFEHGDILAQKTERIMEPLIHLKKHFKDNQLPIIYVNDHYNLWQANLDKILEHCINEKSKNILERLKPNEDDYFLIKPKHSGFYGTALNTLLHSLNIHSLVLAGIAGNICVLFTANDAYMREFSLYIPANCIASVSDEDQLYALRMMENVLKADVSPFQD